jgi:hypothetical protein
MSIGKMVNDSRQGVSLRGGSMPIAAILLGKEIICRAI